MHDWIMALELVKITTKQLVWEIDQTNQASRAQALMGLLFLSVCVCVRLCVRVSVSPCPHIPELHCEVWSIVLITIVLFDVIHSVCVVGLFFALWG